MNSLSLSFDAPEQVTISETELSMPRNNQVLVKTHLSAISAGTELMIYRGEFPDDLPVDETISALSGDFNYPMKYGYCLVGQVIDFGRDVDPSWKDRLVFAFQPHASHFVASVGEIIALPDEISAEEALFLPNMETALSLVMDGKPSIGEDVVVFGQGMVGLLTAAILAQFPLAGLTTFDLHSLRRQASLQVGATDSLSPEELDQVSALLPNGADLAFELTGSPATLDQAIKVTGFAGRVVIGSWYGQKRVELDLGGRFHRSHIRLISSQVSSLAPEFTGRWSKQRRFAFAWEMLRRLKPARFITQRIPFERAEQAYRLLDQEPGQTLQVVLTYDGIRV